MRTNVKIQTSTVTHEGAPSLRRMTPAMELRRTVMACLLFDRSFYESGEDAAARIESLVSKVSFDDAAQIAIDAREKMKLRHVPLWVIRSMLPHHKGKQMGELITQVIQRPDELGELVALYWKDGKRPLTAQLKVGLARALKKFSEYELAKWNKAGAVKLRDVLFLCHARPRDEAQAALFAKLATNTLATPDTWEVALSGGADKKETFTRLIQEKKLGALALLRNLRGMLEAGVPEAIIRQGLASMRTDRVLPFRFVSAAKYAPRLEDALEAAMLRSLGDAERLQGATALLIDHSGSMEQAVSAKSEISRFDAAAALAMILRETCDSARVFTFSDHTIEVPPRRGFALIDAVKAVVHPVGTRLGAAVRHVYAAFPECRRLIVITDEQSKDRPPHPQGRGYIVNVGAYQNGIGYGPWLTIDGWSEAILDYIRHSESIDTP